MSPLPMHTAPSFTPARPIFTFKCDANSNGSVSPVGHSSDGDERATAQFEPVTFSNGIVYFEIHILAGDNPILGLGFAPPKYSRGMVGWYQSSCAYHADDGGIFDNDGTMTGTANYCTVGDVMGVGWNRQGFAGPKEGEIFFVKNGKRLFNCDGLVTRAPSQNLIPTVSIDVNPDIAYLVNTTGPFMHLSLNELLATSEERVTPME
ncbi:hypothetical protein RCL1_005528 [Eukaryota sp. TZLM3-RCL]